MFVVGGYGCRLKHRDTLLSPIELGTYTFVDVVHNFIIVTVEYLCDPSALGAKQILYGKYVLILDKNWIYCKVPVCGENCIGVMVGCNSTLPNKPSLYCAKIKLISETYHSSGLNRSKTTHDGKLFICSDWKSQMASGSRAQVSPSSYHHLFD